MRPADGLAPPAEARVLTLGVPREWNAARRVQAALALVSLTVLIGTGALIAASAAGNHTFLDPAARRGSRSWIDGPLAAVSIHTTIPQFRIELAIMAVAYLGALLCARALRARWILGAIVVLHLMFLVAPPMLSTDVFNYVDYARLAVVHGLDPYAVFPSAVPTDPIYPFVHWRHTHDAYGPLFTLGSYPLAQLGPAGTLWAFKALAAAASLGCVALVWTIARRLGRPPATAVAIFGLNPLLLVWTVGGAHNDLLMMLVMLGAIALVLGSRATLGGAVLAAAVAVKATAGLALPFAILGARRRGWRVAAGAAAVGVGVVVVAFVAFSDHAAGMFQVLSHESGLVGVYGVPNTVGQLFGMTSVTPAARTAAEVLFAASVVWLLVRVWRGGDWVSAVGWALVALIVASSWMLAWYAVWPLALAAVSRDRRLLVAVLSLEAYAMLNEVSVFTP